MFNDFAKRVGADIRTLGRSFDDKHANLENAAQLWIIAPEESLIFTSEARPLTESSKESTKLEEWVLNGGTLVIAPGYKEYIYIGPLIQKTGYALKKIDMPVADDEKIRFTLKPESTGGLLYDVNEIASFLNLPAKGNGSIFRLDGSANGSEILLTDEYGPAAVKVQLGKGVVILLADPYIFSNFLLPASDNSQFAANILAMANGKPIYFDEYHHGYQQHRTFSDVLKTPSGRGVAFLLAVAALAVYSAGRRFGQALPAPLPGKRSAAEYVVSMGLLFKRAGASDLALDVIERDFANFLSRRFHLKTMKPEEVDAQLRLMAFAERKEIVSILDEIEKLHALRRPPARRLLKLSRRIDPLKGVYE